MNFENPLEGGDFFADLFDNKEPMGRFEDGSEGSIFNEMVDAIMLEDHQPEMQRHAQQIPQEIEDDRKSHDSDAKSEDEGLLFKYPLDAKVPNQLPTLKSAVKEPKLAPAVSEDKIFKVSMSNKKMVDRPDDDDKEVIKIEIPLDDDNLTDFDQSEANEIHQKLKQLKRPRRDVTYKTILRKCRKYYQTTFNEMTGYLKGKKKEPCSFYKACILQYMNESFEFKTSLDVSFHLGSLLYPQEMIRGIDSFVYPEGVKTFTPKKVVKRKLEVHKAQVDKLHSILYKFTHEKLDMFIAVPELATIFLNYIQYGAGDDVEDKEYKFEFQDLTRRCLKTLSKTKKVKGIATLFDQ